MATYRFDIPEYDQAFFELMSEVVDGFINLDPLLSQIHRRRVSHSGPMRNIRGEQPLDHPMTDMQHIATISFDAVRESKIDDFVVCVWKMSKDFILMAKQSFYQIINEVTDVTGNVIDAQGSPFSIDMILDGIERVGIEFDDNDEPIIPGIILSPDIFRKFQATPPTLAQARRFEQIIDSARRKWNAQKRTRRLS